MNRVLLIGRVGRTPETSVFENGKKVTKFSLATTEYFGKDNKETSWHNITIWDNYGETMGKLIKTGSQISVEGRLQYSNYEKDGTKCVFSAIVADRIELLDKKSDSNEENYEPSKHERAEEKPDVVGKPKVAISNTRPKVEIPASVEDDLPF